MTYIPARPTTYKGIPMRSRLEARVAAYLDLGFNRGWLYEPRAFANETGQYLPDFQLPADDEFPQDLFVEVRPTLDRAYQACKPMEIIWDSIPNAFLVIAIPDLGQALWRLPDTVWTLTEWEWAAPA